MQWRWPILAHFNVVTAADVGDVSRFFEDENKLREV
jgi:hypothetical protein